MNQDLKSELYKTYAAQYQACYTCWACRATGLRVSNPKDSWHDKHAPKTPCESCSGGYIHCEQDTAADYAAVAFYREWIACCVVERQYPNECAFRSPEQLLLTEKYAPHFAYIIQYPRPAIYETEEWQSYMIAMEPEGSFLLEDEPEPVSHIDGAIEGESLGHRWAKRDWSPDFIDEADFLEAAAREGVDVKAALSQQDAWGRTPLHFGLPPVESKLWDWIDPNMLTGIRCMNASGQCSRFSAYSLYDRYTWTSIANGFFQGHSAVESYLYNSYCPILYYILVDGKREEAMRQSLEAHRQVWRNRIERLCGLLKKERFVLDVDTLTALLELDARACDLQQRREKYFDENYSFWEGDPLAQFRVKLDYEFSRSKASRRACLRIISSAGENCFETQLSAIHNRIATAEILTYEESGDSENEREQRRELMEQGLDQIHDHLKMNRRLAAALDEL